MSGANGIPSSSAADPLRHAGTKRRLFFSFSAQSCSVVIRVAVQLLLVPISLRGWGISLYQDWILITSATGFLSILDLGMQTYFANGLLAAWSRQDTRAYGRLLGTAAGLYSIILGVAAVSLAAAIILVPWSPVLGAKMMSPSSVTATIGLLSVASLILIPFGLLTAIYRAHGDYGLSTTSNAIAEAGRGAAISLVILAGGGPTAASAVYLVIAVVFGIVVVWDQGRRYGVVSFFPVMPTRPEFKEAISQSMRYLVAGLATPILQNAPVLLLGQLSPISGAVVAFSVFRTLTGIARQIVAQLSHAVGGELGRRHFCQDFQGTAVLMSHAGRLVSGSSGLLCGAVLAFSKPFLDVWTQGKVGYDPWLCAIFLLSILVTAPAQVAYMVYLYTNRPNILVLVGGLQVLATVALCAVLVGPYSVIGAALACTAADCLTVGLLLPLMAARSLDLRVLRYLRDCLAVASLCLGLSALVAFGLVRVLPVQGYFGIAAGGVLWAALLAGPAFRLLLTLPQRQWVFEQLHRIVVGLCSLQRKRN